MQVVPHHMRLEGWGCAALAMSVALFAVLFIASVLWGSRLTTEYAPGFRHGAIGQLSPGMDRVAVEAALGPPLGAYLDVSFQTRDGIASGRAIPLWGPGSDAGSLVHQGEMSALPRIEHACEIWYYSRAHRDKSGNRSGAFEFVFVEFDSMGRVASFGTEHMD